jgi:glucokinase
MNSLSFVGIDLGGTKCHGALAGEHGSVIAEARRSTGGGGGAVGAVRDVWNTLSERAEREGLMVTQTVVGVPAVVNQRRGRVTRGPNVGWGDFETREILPEIGSVFFENDANLAAFGELSSGQMRGISNFALFSIGTGFGGALVIGQRVVTGHRGGAGEFGELPLSAPSGCPDDPPSQLEGLVSGLGIAHAATRLAARQHAGGLGFELSSRGVIEAAAQGDSNAEKILDPVLEAIGHLTATLAYIVEPRAVVLDGSVGRALARFVGRIEEFAGRWAERVPSVYVSQLEPNSTVRGAIDLARVLAAPGDGSGLRGLANKGIERD